MECILDNILNFNEKQKKNNNYLNKLCFYFGKTINDEIFNATKKNNNVYDLIPLINSLLNENIKSFNISNHKNIYLDNTILNIKKINNFTTKTMFKKKLLDYKIIELPFQNNNNDLLIKEYCIEKKNENMFSCDRIYNYKETYNELEWIMTFGLSLKLYIYKNSYSLVIEMSNILISDSDIKKIKIFLDNIERILFIY